WQDKWRHRITNTGRARSCATVHQAANENIHCIGIGRDDLADAARIGVEPLFERGIHVTTVLEDVAEGGERGRIHGGELRRRGALDSAEADPSEPALACPPFETPTGR